MIEMIFGFLNIIAYIIRVLFIILICFLLIGFAYIIRRYIKSSKRAIRPQKEIRQNNRVLPDPNDDPDGSYLSRSQLYR